MKKKLVELYMTIAHDCGLECEESQALQNTYAIIKEALAEFTEKCKNPAVWCYGNHTKMLMTDFIFEIKNVKYIVDNNYKDVSSDGFVFIDETLVYEKKIDGIIISSYKYKEEIKEYIRNNLPEIPYLDIYECLGNKGIKCMSEYYNKSHPYDYYRQINQLRNRLENRSNYKDVCLAYEEIVRLFIYLKDFLSAKEYVRDYLTLKYSDKYQELLNKLERIYTMQREAMKDIATSNVIMLCIDGLRRKDVSKSMMPNLVDYIENDMIYFNNAYSISTSTYESLIPAYSENVDLKSKYYENNSISEESCRYIKEAINQGRHIYFYTDTMPFIQSKNIVLKEKMQTASEKMWDFLLDALNEENGLFYIHILYESHFSYPNPYTDAPIVAEGTSIFFDFLPVNGGKIKTDYERQHIDALRYLDDTIIPLLRNLNTNIVLYADHGNVILKEDVSLNEITYPMLTFAEDLIEIPLAVKKRGMKSAWVNSLMSLMDLNDIIISLLKDENINIVKKQYVKVQRSEIYNPDFRYIYRKLHFEKGLGPFELFVFNNGLKLAVYSDGKRELYDLNDNIVYDLDEVNKLYSVIENSVTVLGLVGC